MKARVMYKGDLLSSLKEFPDDLQLGTEVEWVLGRGEQRTRIKTYVIAVRKLGDSQNSIITHEVEVADTLLTSIAATRLVAATIPDEAHLLASDIAVMVMLVNNRIIEGNAGPEIFGLQKRLNALIPTVILKGGANPSAIPFYKDI